MYSRQGSRRRRFKENLVNLLLCIGCENFLRLPRHFDSERQSFSAVDFFVPFPSFFIVTPYLRISFNCCDNTASETAPCS